MPFHGFCDGIYDRPGFEIAFPHWLFRKIGKKLIDLLEKVLEEKPFDHLFLVGHKGPYIVLTPLLDKSYRGRLDLEYTSSRSRKAHPEADLRPNNLNL
jgi:hypothetical protein